ncbi:MAG TPA: hypothetical protein GXX20_08120 [Clostridiaceae bacterium]|nr:hypothetical protein [Clostridiaceae bacterium]
MENSVYEQLVNFIVEICKSKNIKAPEAAELFERLRIDVLEKLLENSNVFYVLKNDGRLEVFDEEKLFISIANASDEINQPLTKSDINNVVAMIVNSAVNGNNRSRIITSKKIRKAVLESLNNMGFQNVGRSFSNYIKV